MSFPEPSHYVCRCGEFFPCSDATHIDSPYVSEFWGAQGVSEGYIPACPNCGEDVDEAWLCDVCQVRRADVEGADMCSICLAEEYKADAQLDQAKEASV